MSTIIINNISGGVLYINDLYGQQISTGETIDMLNLFSYDELSNSIDLKDYIQSGALTLNDGTEQLTTEQAIEHLTTSTKFETRLLNLPDIPDVEPDRLLQGVDSTSVIWAKRDSNSFINLSFGGSKPYIKIRTSSSWKVMGAFIFPGTNIVTTPSILRIMAHLKTPETEGSIRLFDFTNNNVIAEISSFSATSRQIFETDILNNIPEEEAILEYHGMCESDLYLGGLLL